MSAQEEVHKHGESELGCSYYFRRPGLTSASKWSFLDCRIRHVEMVFYRIKSTLERQTSRPVASEFFHVRNGTFANVMFNLLGHFDCVSMVQHNSEADLVENDHGGAKEEDVG